MMSIGACRYRRTTKCQHQRDTAAFTRLAARLSFAAGVLVTSRIVSMNARNTTMRSSDFQAAMSRTFTVGLIGL